MVLVTFMKLWVTKPYFFKDIFSMHNGPTVNYYLKALHLGCCSSPRSVSGNVIVVKNWHRHSIQWILKLAISREGLVEINWFFASFTSSGNIKSYLSKFWVEVVKNGRNYLGYETLKLDVSQQWYDELS